MIKRNFQCLMVTTKDQRNFFTKEQNFRQLIELANTLEAELSVVIVEEAEILDLKKLATAISDPFYRSDVRYKLVDLRLPMKKKAKVGKLSGKDIREEIADLFKQGRFVDLHETVQKYNVSLSSACNYISTVRKEMSAVGYRFEKLKAGRYRLVDSSIPIQSVEHDTDDDD